MFGMLILFVCVVTALVIVIRSRATKIRIAGLKYDNESYAEEVRDLSSSLRERAATAGRYLTELVEARKNTLMHANMRRHAERGQEELREGLKTYHDFFDRLRSRVRNFEALEGPHAEGKLFQLREYASFNNDACAAELKEVHAKQYEVIRDHVMNLGLLERRKNERAMFKLVRVPAKVAATAKSNYKMPQGSSSKGL